MSLKCPYCATVLQETARSEQGKPPGTTLIARWLQCVECNINQREVEWKRVIKDMAHLPRGDR